MYDEYYGFDKKPFSISPDPDFLYLNSSYREALSMLRYGIEERKGLVCLIGEVGTGKTMLLNKLLLSMKKDVIVPSVLFPITGFEQLVGDLINRREVRQQGRLSDGPRPLAPPSEPPEGARTFGPPPYAQEWFLTPDEHGPGFCF